MLPDWRAAAVLLATFGLTLVKDLTAGIVAGCLLAAVFTLLDRFKKN
jgi:SulP family sulfate permease